MKSIHFTGTAGGARWIAHDIGRQTVEVQWNEFEVHHEHATSEWLIAVDREGTVWNARASRAPWLLEAPAARDGPPAFSSSHQNRQKRYSAPSDVATAEHIVKAAGHVGHTRTTDGDRRLRRSVVHQVRHRAVHAEALRAAQA